jgi:hypothetical protein
MPSSSSNKTHLETSLIASFRPIFMHLSLSSRWEELDYLLDTFSQTLDLSDHSLQLAFNPFSLLARAQHAGCPSRNRSAGPGSCS